MRSWSKARLPRTSSTGAQRALRASDPRVRDRQVRRDREVGHADHAAARITVRRAVGGELLEVQVLGRQAGLLEQLASRRVGQVLAGAQEPAGQRVRPVRLVVPLDDQHLQQALAHGQDGQVHGQVQLERLA